LYKSDFFQNDSVYMHRYKIAVKLTVNSTGPGVSNSARYEGIVGRMHQSACCVNFYRL